MKTPIIILAGKAGSGKDTVGTYIATKFGGVTIGLADPMKRFCRDVFGFSEESLWGASELRGVEVEVKPAVQGLRTSGGGPRMDLLREIFGPVMPFDYDAFVALNGWYEEIIRGGWESGGSTRCTLAPRKPLQTLGTEWGRAINRDMWANFAVRTAKELLGGERGYRRAHGLDTSPENHDFVAITDGRFRNELVAVSAVNGLTLKVVRPDTKQVGVAGHKSEKELDEIPRHYYDAVIVNDRSLTELFAEVDFLMDLHYGIRK